VEQRQFSRKIEWESRGDRELNRDIQERASESEPALLMPAGCAAPEHTIIEGPMGSARAGMAASPGLDVSGYAA